MACSRVVDNRTDVLLLDPNFEALIPTLNEFQRRIEYLAEYLKGLERESLALRTAAENIGYVVERLTSHNEGANALAAHP